MVNSHPICLANWGADQTALHDLRHTFASWAVQRGVSLPELKDLLGHTTLAMTMRYAHLAPENLRRSSGRFDGVVDLPFPPRRERRKSPMTSRTASNIGRPAEVTPSVLPIKKSLQKLPY